LLKKYDIGIMILADHRMGSQECQSLAGVCEGMLTKVVVVPDIFGSLGGLFDAQSDIPEQVSGGDYTDYRCEHCLVRVANNHDRVSGNQASVEDNLNG
jgi:hypothetical protein